MYAQERSLVEELKELISHHDMPPVGLGSGRADLHHEPHATHHSWFMECGDPQLMSRMGSAVVSITSGKGVGSHIAQHQPIQFQACSPYFPGCVRR